MGDPAVTLPSFQAKKSLQYSVKTNMGLTHGQDIHMIKTSVELDDEFLGADDTP